MLHNLLKIRYADAPVFLDVASVINSYEWGGDATLSGQAAPIGRSGDTFVALSGTGHYADRPTITYAPLSGEKFARSLISPLPINAILSLIQSGYPVDLVLRICVSSINGLENEFGGSGNPRAGDPRFATLLSVMREAQAAGALGFRLRVTKEGEGPVMFLRPGPEVSEFPARARELLGLDPKVPEYRVVFGAFPTDNTEIAIVSRSMLQVLADFGSYIDVPTKDIAEGRVYVPTRSAEQQRMFPPLMRVHNSEEAPADAYVALRYRDSWFWIDDRDWRSKAVLNALMLMFSLTETGAQQSAAPVVTIPAR
jgi:hypothetical protein